MRMLVSATYAAGFFLLFMAECVGLAVLAMCWHASLTGYWGPEWPDPWSMTIAVTAGFLGFQVALWWLIAVVRHSRRMT